MGCNVTKAFDDQCNDALDCLHYVSGLSPRIDAIRTFEEVLQKPLGKELKEKIYNNVVEKRGARNIVTAIKEMIEAGGDDPEIEMLDDMASVCRAVGLLAASPYVAGKFEQQRIQPLLESLQKRFEDDEFIPHIAGKALKVFKGEGDMSKREYREKQFRELNTANDEDKMDLLVVAISECLNVEDAVVFASKIVYRKVKKPSTLEQLQGNGVYKQIIAMLDGYPQNPDVGVRLCFALAALCEDDDLCVDIGKHRGAEHAVRCLYDYPDHPTVRQQALWLLNELLKHEINYQNLKTLNLPIAMKSMQKMAERAKAKPPLVPARVSSALMRMREEKEEEENQRLRFEGTNKIVPIH